MNFWLSLLSPKSNHNYISRFSFPVTFPDWTSPLPFLVSFLSCLLKIEVSKHKLLFMRKLQELSTIGNSRDILMAELDYLTQVTIFNLLNELKGHDC